MSTRAEAAARTAYRATFPTPLGAWDVDNLEASAARYSAGYRLNYSSFEQTYGDRTYGRMWVAFISAAHHLRTEGAIPPDVLAVVEAYYAVPRYTGTRHDDGIDFATPKARLRDALAAYDPPSYADDPTGL